jgi:hypothetical protein
MRCPACGAATTQYVIDAYVVYDAVSEDGSTTVGPPRIETFDNAFLECPGCGWKAERVEVHIADRHVDEELV